MQIQNQFGRDDTIDPYYFSQPLRGASNNGSGETTNSTYSIERRVGSHGEIYYQFINENTGNAVGDPIKFSANDLLYDDNSSIEYVLSNLVRRDSEIQDALETLDTSVPQKRQTFEDLEISTENKTIQDIVSELVQKDLETGVLIIGTIDNYNDSLPTGLTSADVEIKTIYTENGTYCELNAYSDTVAPYKWTSLYKEDNELMGWTPAYGGEGADAATIVNLQQTVQAHAADEEIHVTVEDRAKWDDHVGARVDSQGVLILYN